MARTIRFHLDENVGYAIATGLRRLEGKTDPTSREPGNGGIVLAGFGEPMHRAYRADHEGGQRIHHLCSFASNIFKPIAGQSTLLSL